VYPYKWWTRALGFGLSCALHLGIAATMSLGPFSYAMMALAFARVPAEALVSAGRRLPLALLRRLNRLRARAILAVAPYVARGRPPKPAARPLPWSKLREAAVLALMAAAVTELGADNPAFLLRTVLALMAAAVTELGADNPAFLLRIPQPDWLRALILYPRLTQRWTMFAPDAPTRDGIAVIDAVTADGRHLDPFTGAPPDFDALDAGRLPHPLEVSEYLFQLHFEDRAVYRRELARFMAEWHEHHGSGPRDRLVSYQAYWVSRKSPPPGSTTPGPTERKLFDGTRFTPQPPRPMLPPRPVSP
jgi:hypothetical protein